jgi:type II secretory ATPase GspE/PulE/Tfp pilus assembly ATPase PilB-like protein
MFSGDPGLEELIMGREKASKITAYLRQRGTRGLLQEGLWKATEGLTTVAEVEREILIPGGDE